MLETNAAWDTKEWLQSIKAYKFVMSQEVMQQSEQLGVLPGLLASPSRTCNSVHSARECSRQSCRKRAWVRLTLFSRDSRATVCSHSFHPLNQLASTPTWSRNIMVCEAGWRLADGRCCNEATSSELYTDGRWQGPICWYVLRTAGRGSSSQSVGGVQLCCEDILSSAGSLESRTVASTRPSTVPPVGYIPAGRAPG